MTSSKKNIIINILKWIGKIGLWLFISVISIILLVFIALNIPVTQRYIGKRAGKFVENKIGTEARIKGIGLNVWFELTIDELYVEDQKADTLVYLHHAAVDVHFWDLLNSTFHVEKVSIDGLHAEIYKQKSDSSFNFLFIPEAFASPTTKESTPVDTTSAGFDIMIDEFESKNLSARFADSTTGLFAKGDLETIQVAINELDLDHQSVEVGSINIADGNWKMIQGKSTETPDTSQTDPWHIKVNTLDILNVKGNLKDPAQHLSMTPAIEKIHLAGLVVDMENATYSLDEIVASKNSFEFITATDTTLVKEADTLSPVEPLDWKVSVEKIDFTDNYIVYYDSTFAIKSDSGKPSFDPYAIAFNSFHFNASSIEATPESAKAHIDALSFKTPDHFALQDFTADVFYDSTTVNIKNKLNTSLSSFDYTIQLQHHDLADLGTYEFKTLTFNGNIDQKDVQYFYPLDQIPPEINTLSFKLNAQGTFDDLKLNQFFAKSDDHLIVDISGKLSHLLRPEELAYDLQINEASTDLKALRNLAKEEVPETVILPQWVTIKGSIAGTTENVKTNLNMNSGLGKVQIDANASLAEKNERFDVDMKVRDLALGELLEQPEKFGKASFNFTAKGQYFEPSKMFGNANLELKKIKIGRHFYENGIVSGNWKNEQLVASAEIHEPHLDFSISTTGQFKDILSTNNLITINNINFKELGVAKKPITLETKASIQTQGTDINNLIVKGDFETGNISDSIYTFKIAPSSINATLKDSSTFFALESPFAEIDFKSSFNVSLLPDVIMHQIDQHIDIDRLTEKEIKHFKNKNFEFEITLLQERIFEEILIPDLNEIEIEKFKGKYTSSNHQIDIEAIIPILHYADFKIDSIDFDTHSDTDSLLASLEVKSIETAGYTIENAAIYAGAANDQLALNVQLKDSINQQKFMIDGVLDKFEDDYRWQTNREGLILYYDLWNVAKDNAIIIPDSGAIRFQNLNFTNGEQSFAIANGENEKLKLNFDQFSLENVTHFVFTDEEMPKGKLNGNVVLQLEPELNFVTDIKVNDFSYAKDTIGNVAIEASSNKPGMYEASLNITGNNRIKGEAIYSQESETIDANLQLIDLNTHTIESYLDGIITNLEGEIKGAIDIKGKVDNPTVNGSIRIPNASFNVVETNTSYTISDSRIEMDRNKISFPQFTVSDIDGSKAKLSGFVTLENLTPDKLNLSLKTNSFKLLDTKKTRNASYYGNVSISSSVNIKGTAERPTVSSKLVLSPESELTIVIPKTEVQVEEYKDIVEFVDLNDTASVSHTEIDSTIISDVLGIQLNAQIEVDEESTLKVILDPVTGDFISLNGNAYLSYEMSRNGTMNLTGTYSVEKGLYQMTYYNLIKREFSIEKGSTVTWYGDPFDATLNISAVYFTEASPLPIVQSQVSESDLDAYKQAIPVDVVLKITEEMSSPSLDFDIRIPENAGIFTSGVVSARIDQLNRRPSELNKQVFSLLILNRFIPEDPSNRTEGNSIGGSTRGTVSELITEQFNTLAGKYIKSVDVTVNLDSYNDYSSGTATGRTDLEIGLSKAVFDERLVVSIESDFNLEGANQAETNGNLGGFIGTAQIEYLLTEDGKYRMRVFRESEYAGIIDGNLTQTGVSFVLTEEFKKLFGDKKSKK